MFRQLIPPPAELRGSSRCAHTGTYALPDNPPFRTLQQVTRYNVSAHGFESFYEANLYMIAGFDHSTNLGPTTTVRLSR